MKFKVTFEVKLNDEELLDETGFTTSDEVLSDLRNILTISIATEDEEITDLVWIEKPKFPEEKEEEPAE